VARASKDKAKQPVGRRLIRLLFDDVLDISFFADSLNLSWVVYFTSSR
jgi:hypothetical protein